MIWQAATLEAAHFETSTARTLSLSVLDWPGHLAGQHVDIRLTASDGYTAVRSYSIASTPSETLIDVTVEELDDGEVSPYLVRGLEVGNQVEIRGPIGGYFVWRPEQGSPVQLIAGGSGIVPLMGMLRTHSEAQHSAPMRVLYSVRTAESVYYADELSRLVTSSPQIAVDFAYTRQAPEGWSEPVGRLSRTTLESKTVSVTEKPDVYVCGPTSFVEGVANWLVDLGHHPALVRTERFGGV